MLWGPTLVFWNLTAAVAANVSQTLLDAGTLLHKQRVAEAVFDQSGAQYKETVLAAFQNVALRYWLREYHQFIPAM